MLLQSRFYVNNYTNKDLETGFLFKHEYYAK
jgi:hypothetical protein